MFSRILIHLFFSVLASNVCYSADNTEAKLQISVENVELTKKNKPSDFDEIIVQPDSQFLLRLTFSGLEDTSSLYAIDNILEKIVRRGLENFSHKYSSQSSTISSHNGYVSKTITMNFILRPKSEGSFRLGPFELSVGKQSFSWPIIKVVAKTTSALGRQRDCYATIEVEKSNKMFVWQQKKMIVQICYNPEVIDYESIKINLPAIQDFEVKLLGEITTEKKTVDSKEYRLLKSYYLLTPKKAGLHAIEPLEVEFLIKNKKIYPENDFAQTLFGMFRDFGTAGFTRTNGLNLNVFDIPQTEGSASFLGSFSSLVMKVEGRGSCERNEPIVMNLRLDGEANFSTIMHPKLNLPSNIKYYTSKSEFVPTQGSGGLMGTKIFEYILQIDASGEIIIPTQTIEYFNPEKGVVESISSNEQKITVIDKNPTNPTKKANTKNKNKLKKANKQTNNDTHNLMLEEAGSLNFKNIPKNICNPQCEIPSLLFLLLLTLSFLISFLYWAWTTLLMFYKKYYILPITKQELDKAFASGQTFLFYKIILTYFSRKLGLNNSEIEYDLLLPTLKTHGNVSEKTWSIFIEFLNKCQAISFGYHKLPTSEQRAFLILAKKWLETFDEYFKTGVLRIDKI